jgi:hypothetical protein
MKKQSTPAPQLTGKTPSQTAAQSSAVKGKPTPSKGFNPDDYVSVTLPRE